MSDKTKSQMATDITAHNFPQCINPGKSCPSKRYGWQCSSIDQMFDCVMESRLDEIQREWEAL